MFKYHSYIIFFSFEIEQWNAFVYNNKSDYGTTALCTFTSKQNHELNSLEERERESTVIAELVRGKIG